ncbi:MAG: acetyl-CoA carboxylase carboxyltransferase subunit alpha [Clostridia bacterium]|nr:acetyl-CoA carboxylase carboxyltransferase subunit alpha [Clostridia bacterium]
MENANITAYDRARAARGSGRPSAGGYMKMLTENFLELHGDRRFGDDPAIVSGIGYIGSKAVTVIAMERGDTIEDRMRRKFGCPTPEGYRKALRLMKEAEKFKRPVVCFIGSSGAYPGIEAEERGQGEAIAENLYEMMTLKTPVISVVVGEGGSGGALALGVANNVVMLENAIYSVISPEACATILWKDSSKAPDAAEALKFTAENLYKFGVIEKVIAETERTTEDIAAELKDYIVNQIELREKMTEEELLDERYNKFRKIGSK